MATGHGAAEGDADRFLDGACGVRVNALGSFWKAGWLITSTSMGICLHAVAAWLTAAAVLLIAVIAARKLGPRMSRVLWPPKCAAIRIIPPADGAYSREAWVSFFRSLRR